MAADFAATFETLRRVMLDAAPGMIVDRDNDGDLNLLAPWPHPLKSREPMWFGGVRIGKTYVSYHLMPLYTCGPLMAAVPDDLKKRMQGKSCFNFKAADDALLADLKILTERCAKAYDKPFSVPEKS